ncbi:unnamed protein product [Ostreobium quekettii]|uniref:Xrn1 N-terminal domain-containing protein n=1 Tax=Ostreobium quekettii TaxID=121088 RepID=A0A8S1IYD8_9CHLO|nr:unnamed protein product [Ostreobium quekettii]|eukprot:evm.model.scf_374.10 EVM.evm.TU.scf_374.10   scf_374:84590-94613(-)
MGIPGFNSWFTSTYAGAFVNLKGLKIDHLYIDMNSVLHLVLRKAYNMGHFHVSLYARLDSIVSAMNPQKSILFALDGPAPLAKLMTQRLRRKKVVLTEAMRKGKVVSALALTPGTPFMAEVSDSLAYYICQRLMTKKFSHLHYELSGATVQGEGEMKILSRLHRPLEHVGQDDAHAVVGNDSDLILMALLTDTPHLHVCGQILEVDPPPLDKMKILSVDALHKLWQRIGPPPVEDAKEKLRRLRGLKQDLALTCILGRGNDYLPAVPGVAMKRFDSFGDHDGLWATYLRMRKLPTYQKRALANRGADGFTVLDAEFVADLLDKASIPQRAQPVTVNIKAADPEQYLQGLSWILDMYQGGVCPDYRFCYDGLGPTSDELCQVLRKFKLAPPAHKKRLQEKAMASAVPKGQQGRALKGQAQQGQRKNDSSSSAMKPVVCAMALLPKQGQSVAPMALRHLMNTDSSIYDMYTDCKECDRLSSEVAAHQVALAQMSRHRLLLQEKLLWLSKSNETDPVLQKETALMSTKIEALKKRITLNAAHRQQHLENAHPYAPFAIHRIEKAVGDVPLSDYPAKERHLAKFGSDFIYRRLDGASKSGQSHSRKASGRGKQNLEKAKDQRLTPPQPPGPRFKALQGPLPILRSLRPPDQAHKVFAGLARFATFLKGKL